MGKYIDADKLIAEIERLGRNWDGVQELQPASLFQADLYELLTLIDSLRQKQPNTQKGKFNFPKFLYARTLDNKTIDISYAPQNMDAIEYVRNNFIEPEQPEVDLKKEIEEGWKELEKDYSPSALDKSYIIVNGLVGEKQFSLIARHFYGLHNRVLEEAARHVYESWMGGTLDDVRRDMVELGKVLNARKED